jgi:hypothetical protein
MRICKPLPEAGARGSILYVALEECPWFSGRVSKIEIVYIQALNVVIQSYFLGNESLFFGQCRAVRKPMRLRCGVNVVIH